MAESFSPDFGRIDKSPPTWSAKRPLRIAVLGDFSAGAGRGRLETGAELARRKPLAVEFDTLEEAMQRLRLSLTLPLGTDGAPVTVALPDLDAFHPDAIYANVPLFSELSSLRRRLQQSGQFAAAAAQVTAWAGQAGARASSLAALAAPRGAAPTRSATLDDFARLTGRRSTGTKADAAVATLVQRVVAPFVREAPGPNKDALVAAVDAGLTDAMRAVLHHPDFQTSESLWRGVDFLVRRLETGPELEIDLIDVSAEEFAADLSRVQELSESGLYRLLVEAPAEDGDGGYTYIAGCYRFDATPPHAELLGRAASVASHAGASLLLGINTDPFADRREPPHRLVKEAFGALRAHPAASFLGLFGPRFLLRHPYGRKSDPISAFAFEEFSRETGLRGMLWGHPALLGLLVLGRSGGALAIDDLPFHHYVDEDGDTVALPCTDRLISGDAASTLRAAGINAVLAHKGQGMVRLNGLEALNGDGLAVPGAQPRKPSSGARMALQARIDTERAGAERAGWTPSARKAGAPAEEPRPTPEEPAADEGAAEAVGEGAEAVEASGADDGEKAEVAVSEATASSSSTDRELADLLATLEEPTAPAADAPGEKPPMDPDLEDLLKSLN